jgi:hypothetical protein
MPRRSTLTQDAVWLFLLGVGFVAPGGWVWGMAGPIGHIENVMLSLWLVTLVLVPVLAWPDPIGRTAQIQAYLLCRSSCYRDTMRKKR